MHSAAFSLSVLDEMDPYGHQLSTLIASLVNGKVDGWSLVAMVWPKIKSISNLAADMTYHATDALTSACMRSAIRNGQSIEVNRFARYIRELNRWTHTRR